MQLEKQSFKLKMFDLYTQKFINSASDEDLDLRSSLAKSINRLRRQVQDQEIAAIDIVKKDDDLEEILQASQIIQQYQNIYFLGVGGSSLAGKTLTAITNPAANLHFIESIDPESISDFIEKIDFNNSFFVVISKSGETIETICQTLIVKDAFEKYQIKDFSNKFLFITQSDENSIGKIAKKLGCDIIFHPKDIGGRYSCFSVVGILPAVISGLDAFKIRSGAKKCLTNFFETDDFEKSCYNQIYYYNKGFDGNVIMPYVDKLKNFTDWYRQLWAESLGKDGFGSLPINSMGTVDQHSQLQLYIDGPKNKFFTFILNKNQKQDFIINDLENCKTLFGGKKLSQILKIEEQTTIQSLQNKNLPIRILELENLDEEVMGGLMMHMFLETIIIAYVKNIDPFDQPAVEDRKNLAKKILNS